MQVLVQDVARSLRSITCISSPWPVRGRATA